MLTSTAHGWISRLILALILLPCVAAADQLVMNNGDIITGDISGIADGKVNIKPAYTDEFAVDLAEVASIEADQTFKVELEDGKEVDAQFAGAADGRQELIVEQRPMTLPMAQIKFAEEPPPYYERISHIDLNSTLRGGNTDSKNTLLYADTRLRLGVHRHIADLTIARDEVDGVSTKEQDLLRYEYNWLLDGPWYVGANASYERDPIKDLDHRYTVGALVGRDIFNDDNRFLTFSFGAGYSDEQLGGVSDSGLVGMWKLIYEQKLFDTRLSLFHNDSLNYQFYGNNNAILKTNTGFRYDILENIYASISLRYDYETEAAPGTKSYDTTLAVGVGAEF